VHPFRVVVLLVIWGVVGCGDSGGVQKDAGTIDAALVTPDAPPALQGLDHRPANATCKAFSPPPATGQVVLVNKFPNVTTISVPTGMFQRPNDNARWYVTERSGRLLSFPNDPAATNADVKVALDLRPNVYTGYDCSLSGIAFPPDFATGKHAFVSYCYYGPQTNNHLQLRISRFATADGGLTFDPASEAIVLAIDYPHDAAHSDVGLHQSDAMRFGADGYLYESIGDGGPQGTGGGNQAQDTNDLRGKLLRIDVHDLTKPGLSTDWSGPAVAGGMARERLSADIPADNPFVAGGGAPAVYAYGFRNPWQWHFDRKDQSIWLGDVGNNTNEEVDRSVVKGGNYGWGVREGFDCANGHTPAQCADPTLQYPMLDYQHGTGAQQGNAITGGVVYRGDGVPSLKNAYIFGDSQSANVWAVRNVDAIVATNSSDRTQEPANELLFAGTARVASFAEDQNGEVFLTLLKAGSGAIVAVEENPSATSDPTAGPPALLSDTGCFEETDAKLPTSGLIPFAPTAELFSDNATKRRWFALPDDQTIVLAADGDFTFPIGSVMVKEFSVAGQRIETRFFVHQDDDRWAGYTYRWRVDQTDADLVSQNAATELIPSTGQTWNFPSRGQCLLCHTSAAGTTLGPELEQLNHDLVYPATGRTANQLETLWSIGILERPAGSPAASALPSLAAVADTTRTTDDRARSYLHVNCSNCHRPEGPTFTPLDLRYQISLGSAGICDQQPTIDDLAAYIPANPRLFAPGDPPRSVLWQRTQTTDVGIRMPPIARTLAHPIGDDVVANWITQTTVCPP